MLPLLRQLNALIAAPAPASRCRWCKSGDGEREDGSLCPWHDAPDVPEPTAAEVERLAAIDREYR